MLLRHVSVLAIRAAVFLAFQPPGKLSTVHEIAAGTGLPKSYLAKVIRKLACAGLVRSFRGPGGGIELGKAPDAISLWSVTRAMDVPFEPEGCVLGSQWCSRGNPCPVDLQWAPLLEEMQKILDQTTLATLIHSVGKRKKSGEKRVGRANNLQVRGNPGESDLRHAL